jgi:hypothetical protein
MRPCTRRAARISPSTGRQRSTTLIVVDAAEMRAVAGRPRRRHPVPDALVDAPDGDGVPVLLSGIVGELVDGPTRHSSTASRSGRSE